MTRPRRDPKAPGVDDVTPQMALEYERDRWPRFSTMIAWWRRVDDELPPELREAARPDARVFLRGFAKANREYQQAERKWREGRFRWLLEKAGEQ